MPVADTVPFVELETLAEFSDVSAVDYIHHGGRHWVVFSLPQGTGGDLDTPTPPAAPIQVWSCADDGSDTQSVDIDTDDCFSFGVQETINSDSGGWWETVFYFAGWFKQALDVRFASDGTNLWLFALTQHTDVYPYTSSDDGTTSPSHPSQADQFIDISTLTSGFTDFYTGDPGGDDAPDNYKRWYKDSLGGFEGLFWADNAPYSDGGVGWSGYWTTPRLRAWTIDSTSATDIGHIDTEFFPDGGDPETATGISGINGGIVGEGGPFDFEAQPGLLARVLSGISVCADPSEEDVAHVVFAEGGAYGRVGAAGSYWEDTTGASVGLAVWDGNWANYGYRVSHSRWSSSAMLDDTDVLSASIDRTGSWFPYDDGTGLKAWGYSFPDGTVFSSVYQVRNDDGSPIMVYAPAFVGHSDAPAADPDGDGNPWLDNFVGGPSAIDAIDLTSNTVAQTFDFALIPTSAEMVAGGSSLGAPNGVRYQVPEYFFDNPSLRPEGGPLVGLSMSNSYEDPTLDGSPLVYAVAISFTTDDGSGPDASAAGFYRIPADLSATFDFIDGKRTVQYSIIVNEGSGAWFLVDTFRRFLEDTRNFWSTYGISGDAECSTIWQLDRVCAKVWQTAPSDIFGGGSFASGIYLNGNNPTGTDSIFFADENVYQLDICRGCTSCSGGLHIWQRI